MADIRTGQCLCGAVTVKTEVTGDVQACHCVQCQRWTGGGPYMCARASNTEVSGGENVIAYHASKWGERVTCKTCGSTLWWKMQDGEVDYVSVGMLDDQTGLTLTEEIFVDYRPDWMPPFPGAAQSTEAEQIAKLDAWMATQGKSVE